MLRRTHRLSGLGDVLDDRLAGLRTRHRGPHRRRWTIRPDDLLVLDVERVNLRIEPGEDGNPARLFRDGSGLAYLIVHFPPQSLAEIAYFTRQEEYPLAVPPGRPSDGTVDTDEPVDDPPIDAVLAGWSRLAFIVRDDQLPIEWTIPGILKAIGDLELSVAPNALPPRNPPRRISPHLEGLLQPAAVAERAILATVAGAGGPPGMEAATSALAAMAGGARDVRSIVRDRRMVRTVGYMLGVSDLSGSATAGLIDELIETELVLPVDLTRPVPRAPSATQTALELPYRLILSPNRHGAWFHATTPVESEATGHTELWHTRLGVRQTNGTLVDGPDPLRTVRAIWTTDKKSPETPALGEAVKPPNPTTADPFRATLDRFDRHNIVHLSSNFRLREIGSKTRFYEPRAVDVNNLALTSLGAWLDSRGAWDDQPLGLSVEEWRHRATLGRDHYVRVVYAGRLFPLGHRASLIKVTERRFAKDKPGNPAYLRQMMFVVVREPLRTYGSSGLTYDGTDPTRAGERWDLKLPFTAARITTTVSPLLDPPEATHIGGLEQACFWPFVGTQPFLFHVIATDVTGRPVEMEMPLIFVIQTQTDYDYADSVVPPDDAKADNETVTNDYRTRTWPGSSQLLAEVRLGGQQVAFARSGKPDDTSFAVQAVTFDAEVPKAQTYDDKMDPRQPRWVPVMRQAQVNVPSLQQIAQTSAPAPVVYPAAYLEAEFEGGNAGEVFLAADPDLPQLDVGFSSRSDRSGGFLAPDMALSGLSRVTGPVSGALDSAINGSFDPAAWFGAISGARLFGVLQLSDIVGSAAFTELDKLPRFVGDTLDDVGRIISTLERLQGLLVADPMPQASVVLTRLQQLTDPDTGLIPGLLTGGDPGAVASQLALLNGELAGLPASLEGSDLGAGARAVITQATTSLSAAIAAFDTSLLADYAAGNFLPEAFAGRFEWRPVLESWPAGDTPIFKPLVERGLVVSVEAVGDELIVTAALDRFDIDLAVLVLHFDRLQFRSRSGRKPEVDVEFKEFEFIGPLSFIQTLRDLIPMDGFSDPPDVTVTPEGITAGFSTGLPNIAVGVFSLENLSLAAGFSVPFVGPPMSTWFRFCERENPARLTVSLFGGGFFFGIVVDAKGLQVAEGAIEFGAAVSVNFGVASGSVSAMAGLYFKIESDDLSLAGYFRLRGEVEALGIVSVCIELYLEMLYEPGSGKCVGTATISVEVEVALFSTTIEITTTKKFAGSGSGPDPTLADTLDLAPDMTSKDWNTYCAAFAA